MAFTMMQNTQHTKIYRPISLGDLTLRFFQQEFLGQMVMTWKTLKRQVVTMGMLLKTLRTYRKVIAPIIELWN